jgi:Uma2 family endonuclease
MSAVAPPIRTISTQRPLTVADLAALPSELPSGPVAYELDNGRLVIKAPPGNEHGAVESNVTADLKVQGERRGLGKVRSGEVAVILWRNPDRVVGADIAFIANHNLPLQVSKEGYLETIPDLVVEVRSKNDSLPEIQEKVNDYITAGVRVVWVADPKERTVTAHRKNQPPQVFSENDMLKVEDLIPGLQLKLSDVFQI